MPKMLINSVLSDKPPQSDGQFKRIPSRFRDQIEANPTAKFPAERGRYHLYLSKACPWCHGVELVLALKGLTDTFTYTWMDPISSEDGWVIGQSQTVPQDEFLYEVYLRADPRYTGSISVPILLDKKSGAIVSNESADIMRLLNSAFFEQGANDWDLYPSDQAAEIDRITDMIQAPIRNGVYRAGFATSQEAYCDAVYRLFDGLEDIEKLLAERTYLAGDLLTEVDLKLFPTLVRFDPVYVTHFKTDRKRIADYPHLTRFMNMILSIPGVADTIDMDHIRAHYFRSHRHINPTGIISIGPVSGLTAQAFREAV